MKRPIPVFLQIAHLEIRKSMREKKYLPPRYFERKDIFVRLMMDENRSNFSIFVAQIFKILGGTPPADEPNFVL